MNEPITAPPAHYVELLARLRDAAAVPAAEFATVDPDALAETEPNWLPVRVRFRVVGRV